MATSCWARFRYNMRVDINLVPLKMTYFIMYAGLAMMLPYIPLFQKQLGMTPVESGIINGIMPFIGFVARPMFGMLADKVRRHRLVFMSCCLSTGLLHLLLMLVPDVSASGSRALDVNMSCLATTTSICHHDVVNIYSRYQHNSTNNTTRCAVKCSLLEDVRICLSTNGLNTCTDGRKDGTFVFSTEITEYEESRVSDFADGVIINTSMPLPDNFSLEKDSFCSGHVLETFVYDKGRYNLLQCANATLQLRCQFFCHQRNCPGERETDGCAFQTTFWSFLIIFLFANIMYSPITNLMDAMAFEMIGEKRHRWGQQRVWGTGGFVLLALCSGPILDTVLRSNGDTNYAVCFYIYSSFMLMAAIFSYFLKVPENFRCSEIMRNTCQLLREFRVMIFLTAVFLLGFFFGVINTFLFWYLTELQLRNNSEHSEKMVIGLALFCASGMELPTIFFSGRIIQKFGEITCLCMAFAGYSVRFMAYYFIQSAWHVLPFELLHGVTFGVMFPAATIYACRISPPGMSATLQGLVSGTHFGFGWGSGALIGGLLYADIGARLFFLSCSVVSAVAMVVFVLLNIFVLKLRKGDTGAVADEINGAVPVGDLLGVEAVSELAIGGAGTNPDSDENPVAPARLDQPLIDQSNQPEKQLMS